jgi:hypothetical protein
MRLGDTYIAMRTEVVSWFDAMWAGFQTSNEDITPQGAAIDAFLPCK